MSHQIPLFQPNSKQRLLSCIFNPHIFLTHAIFLIIIWSSFEIMTISTQRTGTPINPITGERLGSSSTYTKTATKTIVSLSIATSTPTPKITLSSPKLEEIVNEFLEWKTNNSVTLINEILRGPLHYEITNNMSYWNSSLFMNMEHYMSSLETLLGYNSSIYANLFEQAKRINGTIDELSKAGFVVSSDEAYSLTSGLLLDYSFLDVLFKNTSLNLESLRSIRAFPLPSVNLTNISCQDALNKFLKNPDVILSVQRLQERTEMFFQTYSISQLTKLDKRENYIHLFPRLKNDNYNSRLKKKCQQLSIFVVVDYLIWVLLLANLTLVCYKLEVSCFNTILVQQLWHAERLLMGPQEGPHFPVELHKRFKTALHYLMFTTRYTIIEFITEKQFVVIEKLSFQHINNANELVRGRSKTAYHRLRAFNWWIFTNGKDLWIFFVTVVMAFTIICSLLDIETDTADSLTKRYDDYLINYNPSLFENVDQACSNFERDIDNQLKRTLSDLLFNEGNGTLTMACNNIDMGMQELANSLNPLLLNQKLIPTWKFGNLSFNIPVSTLPAFLANSIFNQTISAHEKVTFIPRSLSKRSSTELQKGIKDRVQVSYKRTLVFFLCCVCFHHLLGLLAMIM